MSERAHWRFEDLEIWRLARLGFKASRKLEAYRGVKLVEVFVRPGDAVPEMKSSLARVGRVVAEGATAEEAIRAAKRMRDAITIATVR